MVSRPESRIRIDCGILSLTLCSLVSRYQHFNSCEYHSFLWKASVNSFLIVIFGHKEGETYRMF
jgi:hypothetical protein